MSVSTGFVQVAPWSAERHLHNAGLEAQLQPRALHGKHARRRVLLRRLELLQRQLLLEKRRPAKLRQDVRISNGESN